MLTLEENVLKILDALINTTTVYAAIATTS
jgi:hypothetical protein